MTDMNRIRRLDRDEHGLIVGWLGKLAIAFVLLAVVVFDGGSILVNFFTLDSKADEIAIRLTTDAAATGLSPARLEPEAAALAEEAGARLVDLRVEGNIVYVTLRRRAETLVVDKIGFIRDWARATVEGQAGSG